MATNISKIKIKASPQKIWDIITLPKLVKKWQYGSDLETTWNIGSKISFTSKWEDQVFEQYGIVLEYNPFSNLKYSLFFPRPGLEDKPENYFQMEYLIIPKGKITELHIIQQDNRPGAKQEEEQNEENPVLKELKSLAESEE